MRPCVKMPYHTGIKLRLYLDYRRKHIVGKNAGNRRYVHNELVSLNDERYSLAKTAAYVPAYRDRIQYIDSILRNPEETLSAMLKNSAPFLYDSDSDSMAVDNAIKNYRAAWKKFREDPRVGIPKFHKKKYEISYQTNAHYKKDAEGINDGNVRIEDLHHITLPILGRVRIKGSYKRLRELIGRKDTRIGTITIGRDSIGRYYVSLQIASEHPFTDSLPKTGKKVGIDLNIENFLYDSNGNEVDNPKYRRSLQDVLAKAQRSMSRKADRAMKEGRRLTDCKNYQKARRKVAHLHAKIRERGENFRHVVSKEIVKNHDVIVAEDLKVKNLLKNHKLALAISECAWSDFLHKLEYKSALHGRTFVKVPPMNTTQTCCCCGHVLKGDDKLKLSDREWICPNCGTYHIRDHNASKVILAKGLASL